MGITIDNIGRVFDGESELSGAELTAALTGTYELLTPVISGSLAHSDDGVRGVIGKSSVILEGALLALALSGEFGPIRDQLIVTGGLRFNASGSVMADIDHAQRGAIRIKLQGDLYDQAMSGALGEITDYAPVIEGSCSHNRVGTIDADIDHPELGTIPATLEGIQLERAGQGQYGIVAGYNAPLPTPKRERNWRDSELARTDFSQLPDTPLDSTLYAVYRDKLRRYPEQLDFPLGVRPEL